MHKKKPRRSGVPGKRTAGPFPVQVQHLHPAVPDRVAWPDAAKSWLCDINTADRSAGIAASIRRLSGPLNSRVHAARVENRERVAAALQIDDEFLRVVERKRRDGRGAEHAAQERQETRAGESCLQFAAVGGIDLQRDLVRRRRAFERPCF